MPEIAHISPGPAADGAFCRIHDFVEAQAALTPESCALIHGDERLTYRELNDRSNRFARHLQEIGVGPEVIVAVCLERSISAVLSILAILKAGGAYLPLDPAYPHDRLVYMLDNARAALLITEPETWNGAAGSSPTISVREFEASQGNGYDSAPLPVANVESSLAYVIYTSGSTGRPKGVAMPHGPLVNLLRWQTRACPLANDVRVLQFAPLSFDVSFQEMFSTLGAGGALVLLSEEMRRDPRSLLRFMAEQEIARVFLPPVMLYQLAEQAVSSGIVLSRLREVIVAGEALRITPAVVRFFKSLGGDCTLHNHYGPTETHVVTSYVLAGDPERWPDLPPIGTPIDGVKVLLLDDDGQSVADGAAGSLCVGGNCPARGYLGDPELTRVRFIEWDNGSGVTARLYRTGDLAQRLPGGDLQFLGRSDDQVKIRGFRIELGEIEAVLSRHPGICENAVGVAPDPSGSGQELVGYFVPRVTPPVAITELRRSLLDQLPEYMVPTRFAALDKLPLTPSGKVDRRALLLYPTTRAESKSIGLAQPSTAVEKIIAQVWEEVLALKNPGVREQFFEIGGNSLRAVSVQTKLCERLHREFPITALFQHPTIAALAKYLSTEVGAADNRASVTIGDRARRQQQQQQGAASRLRTAGLDRVLR